MDCGVTENVRVGNAFGGGGVGVGDGDGAGDGEGGVGGGGFTTVPFESEISSIESTPALKINW